MKKRNDEITGQDLAILRLFSKGLSLKDIGKHLHFSPKAITYHLQKIAQTLGVQGKLYLGISGKFNILRQALLRGLIDIDDLKVDKA